LLSAVGQERWTCGPLEESSTGNDSAAARKWNGKIAIAIKVERKFRDVTPKFIKSI
jgi:hypothetical protein